MKTRLLALLPIAALMLGMVGCNAKQESAATAPGLDDAVSTATDAYIYAYPLVTMDMTRRKMTNVVTPVATMGPMGRMLKVRTYPPEDYRDVTAPNADTLYTVTWLDLSKEPWIFSIPDMGSRYFLMPMLDGWTDVFQSPGTRTTGGKAQKYAITGPGWTGALPAGVTEYKAPTAMVWILGRIYCTGTPQDYAAVHALQDKFSVVPLSSYGKPYTSPDGVIDPNFDMKTTVRDQVEALDLNAYFKYLAQLLKTNPPAAEDAPMVARLAKVGVVPGQDFDPSKLAAFDQHAINAVPKTAQAQIMGNMKDIGKNINGWTFSPNLGTYGTQYLNRALVTAIGLGANLSKDAIYPTSTTDSNGKDYDGASSKYTMHFDKGQFPPVNAFWSLTMYDGGYFFVPNALHRQTLSSRDKFVTNADGSVDLYLQAESPGKAKEANWLPAPKGKFIPMLRLYWPKDTSPTILDGSWVLPPVNKVS